MKKKQVLSIAGSDSGAGAGVQADLKTFSALNVYGATVITSITSQNTIGVQKTFNLPTKHIKSQINSILDDFNIKAIKIGMINSQEIIKTISSSLKDLDTPIVLDPVMVSESGDLLIKKDSISTLKKELIPLSEVITPNKNEAEKLAKTNIKNQSDIKDACKKIIELGTASVVITGGHFDGNDYFYDKNNLEKIKGSIFDQKTHGSGCTYSSAITSYLAKDNDLKKSVKKAKKFTEKSIRFSEEVGSGRNKPVNQLCELKRKSDRFYVLNNLKKALENLQNGFNDFIPEVGSNIGMCIPSPSSIKDVAALPGRIVSKGEDYEVVGSPWYGASSHVARLILSINEFNSEKKAAMNIKYRKKFLKKFKEQGLSISSFSRKNVPEKDTMSFGAREAIKKSEKVPEIIYDEGAVGKEPMIRIIGDSATKVVKKVNLLL